MATTVDLVMFVVPLVLALVFSMLTLAQKGKEKSTNIFSNSMVTFMSSIIASICWFIFGLTWPAIATSGLFVSVAYLWYGIGVIFVAFTIAVGLRMLYTALETESPPRLKLKVSDEEE